MKIKINIEKKYESNEKIIMVQLFSSEDAYNYPDTHQDKIWNTALSIDLNEIHKGPYIFINTIENLVNACLKRAEEDEFKNRKK